jgi:probable rRNA maturation factor
MIANRQGLAAPGAEMAILIDVEDDGWRRVKDLEALAERAVTATLAHERRVDALEISVLFAGDQQAARVNERWRHKSYAPNVLSFPAPPETRIPDGEARPLGDIVLAAGTVAREARVQGKTLEAHTSHLIVHGTLHLLGYDHVTRTGTARMEAAETAILDGLGYPDPYAR